MMRIKQFCRMTLGLLAVLSLVGCGGGGSSSSSSGASGAGGASSGGGSSSTGGSNSDGGSAGGSTGGTPIIGGLVSGGASLVVDSNQPDVVLEVASGGTGAVVDLIEIDAFGSIIFNGRTVNTDAAEFFVEGLPAVQSDLAQGQSVLVLSQAGGEDANSVHYRANVIGPATSVNLIDPLSARAELTIMGQRVNTNASTVFSGLGVAQLSVNETYEISGTLGEDGVIAASYVELRPSDSEVKVMGVVANLAGSSFTVNELQIDSSSASLINFNGVLEEGDVVEVRAAAADFSAPISLFALEIERLPSLTIGGAVEVEVDGYVDSFLSSSDFSVQSLPVSTSNQTAVLNGSLSNIALGSKLKVSGAIQSTGALLATSISIQPTEAVRAEGPIESIDLVNEAIDVLGVTFSVRAGSILEDDSDLEVEPLTLNDLGIGDTVEIRGTIDGAELVAMRAERDDPRERARLKGPVSAFSTNDETLTILDVNLNWDAGVTEFRDAADNVITSQAFFDAVSVGSFVSARWDVFSSIDEVLDELSLEE